MSAAKGTRPSGLRPWRPGQSGNPGGRPKIVAEVVSLARQYAPEAIAKLVNLMRSAPKAETRLAAALALLDRGFGRAPAHDSPLVAVNIGGPPPPGGATLTPEEAYAALLRTTSLADTEAIIGRMERPKAALAAPPDAEGPGGGETT